MTAAEAVAERDRVLDEVEVAKRRVIDAGLDVLRRWAARGEPFSANSVRAELRKVGVEGAAVGPLFNAGKRAKIIRSIGVVRSTDPGTHGKAVAQYIAADRPSGLSSLIPTAPVGEVVHVPTVRDGRGRFTRDPSTPTPDALFDLPEEVQ